MSNKIVDMKGRPLASSVKPEAGPACLYYLSNGVILFAEDKAVELQAERYVFDMYDTVGILINPANGQMNTVRAMDAFPGRPTFYRPTKQDVRGISDCTDETLLMQLRAVRAGLVPVAAAPEGEGGN